MPNATFVGLGGREMERAGQVRVVRAEDVAVMGVTEILRHVPRIYASYRLLVASMKRERPDLAVLIDFPDVNFRLAKRLHRGRCAGRLVCESAALGMEAAAAALGSGAGGQDAGDLSV